MAAGTRHCGHDDYHDAHEWADRPHIWCPGHSLTEKPTEISLPDLCTYGEGRADEQ
ncbi:hypothetical protein [Streptomyces sp. NBC_00046]|uniref:hypothetical protein n=1 Tax=Streptomyces sp. NBC_00046 TaxID=2975626 RepID=UPI0032544632